MLDLKSVILRRVLDVVFQKARVFVIGGTSRNRQAPRVHERILYHIEVRTLYARRMFREYIK